MGLSRKDQSGGGLANSSLFSAQAASNDIASISPTDGQFIVGDGENWVGESDSIARTSLALGTANSPQFTGLTLTGSLIRNGSTSGTITFNVPATITSYTLTWPSAVAAVSGYVLSSDTSGNLSWVASGSGGSGVTDASYVVLGNHSSLSAERVLTGTANQITITDNGANSTVVLSTPQNIHSGASPTFASLSLTGNSNQIILDSDGTSTTLTAAASAARVITFPDTTDTLVALALAQTLTNKTLTSPQITTSLTTGSTTFALINTTATTVNFAGAATTVNMGAASMSLNLGSGSVVNIASSNWVATHTSGILTVGTGDLRITTAGTNTASVVTVGGTQTLTSKSLTSPTITTYPTAAGATWTDLGSVTTADINGGTIDGVTIGGSVAGAATITTLTTSGNIELGNASDTTLSRSGAGDMTIEGNAIYRAGGTDVPVADGGTGSSTASGARTNLGIVIGSDVQAYNSKLADIAGASWAQGDVIYYNGTNLVRLPAGTSGQFLKTNGSSANPAWASVSGGGDLLAANNLSDVASTATSRTNLGLGTGDSPQFTAVNIGNADTTLARSGAGDLTVEGNALYRAGGTDVPVADGGTGASTAANARTNLGLGTGDSPTFTNLTVSGDLTVQGDTVTIDVATLTVEDPLISLAKANSSTDALDIGFYGLYDTTGSQDLHAGIFRDADDNKFKAFVGLQTAPTTTVNISGTGYTAATLVLGTLETTTIEIGASATDTTLARASAGDVSIEGNVIYRAGGTDVPVTDGGTGSSTASGARTNLGLAIGSDVQAYHARLADVAGASWAQGDVIYYNGTNLVRLAAGTSGQFLKTNGASANPTWSSAGTGDLLSTNNLSDVASAATSRTNLGLGSIATQASSNVSISGGAITGITDLAVADGGTGASTASGARTNLGVVIGTDVQAYDAELAALAGLTSAADKVPYFTGSGTASVADFSAAGRALVDDADASAQRTTLGLGSIATQASGSVSISGGSITGITDLAVADGGTGASSLTAYAVLAGGTTGTGAIQSIASVGTAGQVLTSNGAGALPTFQAAGGGDVVGPSSATDNAITRFDNTTGKLVQNSSVTISDTGAIVAPSVGSVIPFFYADQTSFPSASTYHGAIAHSHSDGAMYFAHGGSWVRLLENGGPLGTPSSATLTNATGLPVSGITASTSTALGVGSIELGHASDTTLTRSANGIVQIEGVTVATASNTLTLTNKSIVASQITAGTFAAGTFSFSGSTISNLGTVTTADIDGGTVDGTIIGGSSAAAGTFTNVVVTGDLTVNGDTVTVNTSTLSVEDPLIYLANGNNSADTIDIGFYGLYDTTGSQDLHAGIFRDASDNKFKAFVGLQTAPTTTVDVSGTGYTAATLVLGTLETTTIELGHVSDTTLSRSSAGIVQIEGVTVATASNTLTLTNKSIVASQITAGTFAAGTYSFSGSTISNLGTVTTADIDGGTIDGVTIGGSSAGAGTFTTVVASTSVSTPSIITASGALTVTPAAGSNLNVSLSTTGDFAVNTNHLYVDTSAALVGIGTSSPTGLLDVNNTTTKDITAGANARVLNVQGSFTAASSGTHARIMGVEITPPTITGGAATIANTASLYISNAPTATVSGQNYALWVDEGAVRFDVTSNTQYAFLLRDSTSSVDAYYLDSRNTTSGIYTHTFRGISPTIASASSANYSVMRVAGTVIYLTGTTPVDNFTGLGLWVGTPQITNSSAVTVSHASTVYIADAPAIGGSVTISNAYALHVASGTSKFQALTATTGTFTALELGSGTTDTTLSRSSAGVLAVEGVVVPTISSTNTLTNKRIDPRTNTTTTGTSVPSINTDTTDIYTITAQAEAITSMSTNLSGTPVNGQTLVIRIKDNGTARAITWGSSFTAVGITLPTTTTANKLTYVGFMYNSTSAKWDALATVTEA